MPLTGIFKKGGGRSLEEGVLGVWTEIRPLYKVTHFCLARAKGTELCLLPTGGSDGHSQEDFDYKELISWNAKYLRF